MIQLSISVAVTLVIAFLVCVAGFGRVLLGQFEKRMAERFASVEAQLQTESRGLQELRLEVQKITRTLPLEYVRREDWIRFSTVIDAKLDRLLARSVQGKV